MVARSFVRFSLFVLSCAAVLTAISSVPDAEAADKKKVRPKPNKVAGILIEKKDNWISVKADGEDQPVKYQISASDRGVTEAMTHIFDAARVQLIYKQDGETRQLAGIERQVFAENGTITGSVVKVYNDFWVEVKPKSGVSDAYAAGLNYKDKAFMDMLKGLKPGDLVTIQFYTDFERHRIETMVVNKRAAANSLDGTSLQPRSSQKKSK